MMYPSNEYAYVDENGQNVEPSTFVQQFYTDNNDPPSSHIIMDENMYDINQQQVQYRSTTADGSQPLAKCSVLYLGTAISSPGQRGIDAIQEPLSRRYPVDGKEVVRGIEAWLSLYDNGLQLQFARDPSVVLFYPIRSLVYCASIRFATRTQTGAEFPNGWRFVPLDSPAAARVENTRNPPLFAVTFRRTRHLPVDECHCFVTKTNQAALALVQACFSAYQATVPQQDCSKVPLYFKVDDYGSKNKEIDNEIRIIPAPDRERTLDYQTNTEGVGFFYKTDRVPIDSWQLWEHQKNDIDRSASAKNRFPSSRSRSHSSSRSSSFSTSSSCSSCRHSRRSRRRRRASLASISTTQQQQQQQQQSFHGSDSQSLLTNNGGATTSAQQTAVDPYAAAANLIRVERIKDVNSGQDVFIRWVSDTNSPGGSTQNNDQQSSAPQQAYSNQPPRGSPSNYTQHSDRELPNDIERLALEDEYLRKSLLFDERPSSKHKQKKQRKREKYREPNSQETGYEVVSGFFEDRHGKKRSVKLDRTRINTVKNYRHLFDEVVNSSAPQNDQRYSRRAVSMGRPMIQEQQQYPTPNFPLPNQPLIRPFGPTFLPRNAHFYPQQPLFSQPNFINRLPIARPPFWYRPM